MILYHAITNYHILCCILHKIKYNSNKECVLYISRLNKDRKKLEKTIKHSNFFKDVKIFQEYTFANIKNIDKQKNILEKIVDYVNTENEINFSEIEEYNICGDHYALGMYLVKNNIRYNYFEDACGILSQKEVAAGYTKKTREWQYNLTQKLQLFGESDLVIKRYGDLSKQTNGYYNNKDVDFSISKILKKITKNEINKIISVFQDNIKDSIKSLKVDLLLTQYFIGLGFMTYEEQQNLYTLLVDYFGSGNQLVIKPHPSDVHGLYKQWFPEAIVLNRTLPSELLEYCIDAKIENGITASSTALLGMNNINKSIGFNNTIEIKYKDINRYYMGLKIVNKLLHNDQKIYSLGTYNELLEQIANKYEIELPEIQTLDKIKYPEFSEASKIFIVDDLSEMSLHPRKEFSKFLQNLTKNDIVIYLNSNEKAYFYTGYHFKKIANIVFIPIEKKQLRDNIDVELLNEEWLYVYCPKIEDKEKISNMSEKIKLEKTGIEISINPKDKIEIKTLEGILRATETRLLEEIKVSKSLREERDKMLNSTSWKITKPLRNISKYIKKIKKRKNK